MLIISYCCIYIFIACCLFLCCISCCIFFFSFVFSLVGCCFLFFSFSFCVSSITLALFENSKNPRSFHGFQCAILQVTMCKIAYYVILTICQCECTKHVEHHDK